MNKLDTNYLYEVDKKELFISLTIDWCFKKVFDKYPVLLNILLNSTLGINIDIDNISFERNELLKEKKNEYNKSVDVLLKVDKYTIIDIELNSTSFESCKDRNIAYVDKLYGTIFEKGSKNLDKYKVIQLNLNTIELNINKNKYDVIYETGKRTGKIYTKNKKIVLKYLAYYRYLYYTRNIRTKEVVILTALTSKSFTELYQILSNVIPENELEKIMKGMIEMFSEEFHLHDWEREKWDKIIRDKEIEISKQEGIDIGMQEGKKEGKQEGIMAIIKNMLNNSFTLNQISEATGKSISEIKKIAKTM